MRTEIDGRPQDGERLYEELMGSDAEFYAGLERLAERALNSDAPDRYQQMWKAYLSVMTKIGGELFGGDVYWNTDSERIEPVLDMLLCQGYVDKILRSILGASDLLLRMGEDGDAYLTERLREIATRYHAVVRYFEDGGVLTSEDRLVKWDLIDESNRSFGHAYDIVAELSRPPKSAEVLKKGQEEREAQQRALEKWFDELFGEPDPPPRNMIERILRRVFPKRKR